MLYVKVGKSYRFRICQTSTEFDLDLVEDARIRDHIHGEIAEKIEELQMLQPW